MAESEWVTFGAAVGGAIVGGLASLGGSILVSRREVVRATRLRMFDVPVPSIWNRVDKGLPTLYGREANSELKRDIDALRRAGVIVGRRERRLARRLKDEYSEAEYAISSSDATDEYNNPAMDADSELRQAVAQDKMRNTLRKLNARLERKLS